MSVYNARPYHAYCLSDDGQEDDDICMPELSDIYDSEEWEWETSYPIPTKVVIGGEAQAHDSGARNRREVNDNSINTVKTSVEDSEDSEDSEKGIDEFEERQIRSALSTAHKNLTKMSQLVLKLEYRTGKVTKEGIRQTLDATAAENYSSPGHHLEELEEIKFLSRSAWKRLYLIDRHWSRQSCSVHDSRGRSPGLRLRSDPSIKAMLKEEMRMNHLAGDDTRCFTVGDLANGRRFKDWVAYLRDLCEFKDHPTDEAKLLELAWLFLDRALRGPRPMASTKIDVFVAELEDKFTRGGFEEALKTPQKQQEEDEQAWKVIKKHWS
ncbi:hypothetical protein F4818DRAFT_393741 [Hypoxylon cercidicola]|nr:hypothetical protein F4818DRAFT_393741 [Hypoxylon cercidicola]